MVALAVSLMATWEALCSTMGSGLVSGGPVSLVYGFIGKTHYSYVLVRAKSMRSILYW